MHGFASLALLVLAASAALQAATTPLTACGAPGIGPCPLQEVMRERLARPYALRRFDELARNAEALVALNPNPNSKAWRDWDAFARDVAQGAADHDDERTLRACIHCHHRYRREYVENYRQRVLSPVPASSEQLR